MDRWHCWTALLGVPEGLMPLAADAHELPERAYLAQLVDGLVALAWEVMATMARKNCHQQFAAFFQRQIVLDPESTRLHP
jgi:hypothetical protein